MLDAFAYPVSGVMKLWHLLLHGALGIEESIAWLLAIVGLVVTVRGLLVPFFWTQYRSGRTNALMLPERHRLDEEYGERTDLAGVATHQQKIAELNKRYGYKPLAGCVPPLIQIPAFMGLYRVMIRMARPAEGLDAEHSAIGFLSPADVESFLRTTVFGVPLPAYRRMDPQLLAELGTTRGEVAGFILPILLLAVSFTTLNMGLSIYRNFQQLNYDSQATVRMNRVLIGMLIFIPLMLLNLGWNGPLPVAIILYWFANNLWTLSQQTALHIALTLRYPLTAEFHGFKHERKAAFKKRARDEKRRKRRLRGLKARGVLQPWRLGEIRAEVRADKQRRRDEKARTRQVKKSQTKARAEIQRLQRAHRRAVQKGWKPHTGGATPIGARKLFAEAGGGSAAVDDPQGTVTRAAAEYIGRHRLREPDTGADGGRRYVGRHRLREPRAGQRGQIE